MNRRAFTLVELLVVVTIIVILIAILLPAMSKSIYTANVAVCGSTLKGVASSVFHYAMDNKRTYPKEIGVRSQPATINAELGTNDFRPILRKVFDINKFLNCPLNGFVDFETQHPASQGAWVDYNLYFGWAFAGQTPMERIGDRWTIQGGASFNVIAADRDLVMPGRPEIQSSHPDRNNLGTLYVIQDDKGLWGQQVCTISLWDSKPKLDHKRGDIDQNTAFDDGSVHCTWNMKYDDDRMTKVHTWQNNREFPGAYSQLPR